MIVAEMLQIPSLNRLKIIAGGSGINRRVTTVTVMDAPDIYNWMKGGEFLITSAYAVKDDAKYLTSLVEKLNAAGVAAFGIKVSRFIGSLPQSTLDMADRLGIPLIYIPEDYSFADIINPTLYSIVDQQASMLLQAEKIHAAFLDMAVNGKGVHEILLVLSGILKTPVAFADTYFNKLFLSYENSTGAEDLKKWFEGGSDIAEIKDAFEVYRLTNDRNPYGYLLVQKIPGNEAKTAYFSTAVEYAIIVLTLDLQKRLSNHRIEEKYRDEFLADLIYNNIKSEAEIHNRAGIYNWDFPYGGLVAIVDVNNIKQIYLKDIDHKINAVVEDSVHSIFEISHQMMITQFRNAKYYKLSDHIIYLISEQESERWRLSERLEAVFGQMQKKINEDTRYTITMGIGGYRSNIKDIHESYEEAKMAIKLGYQLKMFDCTLFYERLGIYRLLSTIVNTPAAQEYYTKYVLPILEYDNKHHSDLLETVQALVQHGWNLQESSEALFIHYNTMKYRYVKISDILSIDLKLHEQRLNLEIAVKLYLIDNRNRF